MIKLHSDMILPEGNLLNLIDFIYLNLIQNSGNANYFIRRIILTSKNIDVDKISDTILERFPDKVHLYSSVDSVDSTENVNTEQPQLYSPEFLRFLIISELPPGELKLKVRVPIMLLRNLNSSEGLCNRTRLIYRGLQNKVIDVEIITGFHLSKRVFIFQITITSFDNNLLFILKR